MAESHLFCVALGPVQTFIEAARRMRDLHQGSHILSELAQSLALHLETKHHARMIFPSSSGTPAEADKAGDTTNKLLCVLPPRLDPSAVARDLSNRLVEELHRKGDQCLAQLESKRLDRAVNSSEFRHQIADCIQLYAAWCQLPGSADDGQAYARAYAQVSHALDSRKQTRSFASNEDAPDGVQLSSLDGLRESVLRDARADVDEPTAKVVQRLRVWLGFSLGEHLDAMGLTKRTLGRTALFPAISRVVLQPWIQAMAESSRRELDTCLQALPEKLVRKSRCYPGEPLAVLPFDCEILLPGRLDVLRQQLIDMDDLDAPALEKGHAALDRLQLLLDRRDEQGQFVIDLPREDSPHVALLMADGDKMGVLLSELARLQGAAGHAAIAQCMQQTAALAHRIVRDHGGCTLYAGGDDVMAALPVQSALACAQALQRELTALLQQSLPVGLAQRATLSVGIAMAHVLTPMGQLRRLAQRALHWAKTGPDGAQAKAGLRDALCVWVEPRGGLGRPCVGRWRGVDEQSMVERLEHWQSAFKSGDVARSLPYDLMTEISGEQDWAIPAAIHRLLTRRLHADEAASKRLATDVQALIEFWKGFAPRSGQIQWICERLADELYVSRWLQAQPQPLPSTLFEPSGAAHA